MIARLAAEGVPASCSWERVLDRKLHRVLDLSDPFASDEVWQPIEAAPADLDDPSCEVMALLHRRGL